MGWDDWDFGGFDDDGSSSALDNFEFGGFDDNGDSGIEYESATGEGWYSDDVWDEVFDDSFDLPGSTTEDTAWWQDVWNAANTPLGTGIIGGLADGYQSYQRNKTYENAAGKLFDDRVNTRKKHNTSINKAPGHIAKVASFPGNNP